MPLASFCKQNLLLEFASLKHACPDGVYVTITPGEASLWSGVLFVRRGPYSPAVLRFQISFSSQFPATPPLITFSSDIFHPLLTPLTTYTHTTNGPDTETVSASDNDRLPPGGFNLRHGFPHWFSRSTNRDTSAKKANVSSGMSSSTSASQLRTVSVYQLLDYIRSAFSEEEFLDSIVLEVAANPGAFHAWQTHRAKVLDRAAGQSIQFPPPSGRSSELSPSLSSSSMTKARKPGEWNWEGVWEERVRRGVQNSLLEPVLYGSAGNADDIIRFADLESIALQRIKDNIARAY